MSLTPLQKMAIKYLATSFSYGFYRGLRSTEINYYTGKLSTQNESFTYNFSVSFLNGLTYMNPSVFLLKSFLLLKRIENKLEGINPSSYKGCYMEIGGRVNYNVL